MAKRILIVEDDTVTSKMYMLELANLGYEISVAKNGKEAIAAIEKAQPDLMLLDLLMPEMDGFEVLRLIKAKSNSFPVVVLSNLSQDLNREKCKLLGARDYFVKTDMELSELKNIIKKYA